MYKDWGMGQGGTGTTALGWPCNKNRIQLPSSPHTQESANDYNKPVAMILFSLGQTKNKKQKQKRKYRWRMSCFSAFSGA